MEGYIRLHGIWTSYSHNVYTFISLHTLFQAPDLDPMAVWDLVCAWRRYLVFLSRGLCACSLAALYLFIGLVLCSGYRTAGTAPLSHLQASLGEESTGTLPSSVAEEESPAISETTRVGFDAPFNAHYHPRFADRHPLVRPMVIPKIVVQDFSAEDGSIHYKTPEYDLTHALKRRRRLSWAPRIPVTLGDNLVVNTRPSLRLPPTLGVGGLRSLYLAEGLKHRRSDVFVQNHNGFPSRKRVLGDVVAKDSSFVIVGL